MITTPSKLLTQLTSDMQHDLFTSNVLGVNSHFTTHEHKTDTEILNRLLHEEIYYNTKFNDNVNVYDCMYDAIIKNANEICDWLENPVNHKQVFHYSYPHESVPNCIGTGYAKPKKENTITKYKTNTISIVLEYDSNNKYGFTVTSIYPNITPHAANREIIDCNITSILRKTETYQQASPVQKAYFEYLTKPNPKPVVGYYDNRTNRGEALNLYIPNKNGMESIVSIRENTNDCFMWTQDSDKNKRKTNFTNKQKEITGRDSFYVKFNNKEVYDYFATTFPKRVKQIEQLQNLIKQCSDTKEPKQQLKELPTVIVEPTEDDLHDEIEF